MKSQKTIKKLGKGAMSFGAIGCEMRMASHKKQ